MMSRDGFEDATDECACFQRLMVGNCEMMHAIDLRREPDVRAVATNEFVTEDSECFDEVRSVNIARDFHGARTSSRTK